MPFLRSLRSRLILLFAALAVGPLATVGLLDYARSRQLIRALIVAQTDPLTQRAAARLADRYAVVRSDILLMSENAEVQQLLRARALGDSSVIRIAQRAAETYLQEVWRLAGATYYTAELADAHGVRLWSAGDEATAPADADRRLSINETVRDLESKRVVGVLRLAPRATALFPADLFAPSFGRSGYGMVIDRMSNRLLVSSSPPNTRMTARELVGSVWSEDSMRFARGTGTLEYTVRDSVRIASYVSLDAPQWTVLSSTALDEFAEPFARAHRDNLALLGVIIGVVAVLFVIFIGRATRSLEELTRATAAVGRGDLSPPLPSAGSDEVGALSQAFADMTRRIRSMVREIEMSRQLAVLGEFAAQLSHEVRNPLTSLKLDLQGLQRQIRSGTLSASAAAPVESSLREVSRLDTVVRGVLELARQSGDSHRPFNLDDVIEHSLSALRPQIDQRHVAVEYEPIREPTRLIGDPERLSGMLMNLVINAAEAQPHGGRVRVSSLRRRSGDGTAWVDLTVSDDGPGVAPDLREEVFRPFYTSRHDGTGLGLPLALRTAREHGGSIACHAAADGYTGAAFTVSLPVPMT